VQLLLLLLLLQDPTWPHAASAAYVQHPAAGLPHDPRQ
jgi:hypothetical protein